MYTYTYVYVYHNSEIGSEIGIGFGNISKYFHTICPHQKIKSYTFIFIFVVYVTENFMFGFTRKILIPTTHYKYLIMLTS